MEKPTATLDLSPNGKTLETRVSEFFRGGLDPDDRDELDDKGRGDLAMVLIDTDYDGETFDLDDYFFGEDLAKNDWRFGIPIDEVGEKLLVVLMDTHGNELAQALDPAALSV